MTAMDSRLVDPSPCSPLQEGSSSGTTQKGIKSMMSAVFLMGSCSLGVGVFAMPTVVVKLGLTIGIAMLMFFGVLSTALMMLTLGLAEQHDWDRWRRLIGLICLKSDMRALSGVGWCVSSVVVVSSVAVVVCSLGRVAQGKEAKGAEALPAWPTGVADVLTSMPTICFAYTSMLGCFDTLRSMKLGRPTDAYSKMRQAAVSSGFLLAIVYTGVGVMGAWAYGSVAGKASGGHGDGNVIYNIPKTNYIVCALRLALVVVITLDYPIINFPIVNMLLGVRDGALAKCGWGARGVLSLCIAGLILLLNLAVPDLPAIFGLCGSLGVSLFCYALPGLVLLRAHPSMGAKAVGALAALVGFTMLFVSTGYIVAGLISRKR